MSYGFNDELSASEELYRNTLVVAAKLMTVEQFNQLKFHFRARNSETNEKLDIEFTKDVFAEVKGEAAANLIKMAAFNEIEGTRDVSRQKELSIKH